MLLALERVLANPRVVALSLVLIVVAGLNAINTLPRQEDPRITNRNGIVLVRLPGASAERIEALVAEPIERSLREKPEIEHITVNARAGIVALSIELKDSVRRGQADALWTELRDKLRQVPLPAGASAPLLDSERGHAFTWIGALRWDGSHPDILASGRHARELASRLTNLPGTDVVRLYGLPEEEVQVAVDPARAAALGLRVADIARRVQESDAKVASGELNNGEHRLTLEVAGALEQLERVRRIPLLTDQRGITLQLGDLAEVRRDERTPPADYAIVDGERAVVLAVRMLPGYRGDRWTRQLHTLVADFQAELPAELQVDELFVQQRYTKARLSELVGNIMLGFGLIVLVLWLTLGRRAALLVAASLPVTVLFALACMRFTHLPIHQMSVTGLIVALGIMVDNAIVMADTVTRYRRDGMRAIAAAARAVRHLWLPLLGSTLTTVLAFMPIVLMPGPAGEFVGGIALAVSFSLVGSWLISLFIVAPLAGLWLRPEQGHGIRMPRLGQRFRRLLHWVLVRPRRVMAAILTLPLLGFVAGSQLPEQFFPVSDRDMINLELFLPASASIEATRRATAELGTVLAEYPEIESLHWFVGRSAPPFYYNLMDRRDGSPFYAQAMLRATDFRAANRLVDTLQRRLDRDFPRYQVILRRLEQGPPSAAPIELRIVGPDLDLLRSLGDEVRRVALETRDVVQVRDSLGESVPKLWLHADEIGGRLGGMALTELAASLQADLDGRSGGSLLEATEQLPVRVQSAGARSGDIQALQRLDVVLPGGNRPLMALAEARLAPAPALITRRDGERINNIEVYVRDTVLPSVVLERVRSALDAGGFHLPAGYRLEIGGESENRSEAVTKLMGSVSIIAVLLVVTVVMSFNSFRLSLIVFAVAVQAAGLGMLSLALSGYPFGFNCIVAVMGLVGLAVNAAIVILTELRESDAAMAADTAAIEAAVAACTRHISSTTVTTVVGLMPLIFSGGGFWPPFAVVLAGGTVLATLLSLLFVPCAFLLLRQPGAGRLWRARAPEQPLAA